jgi:hypothetical protein
MGRKRTDRPFAVALFGLQLTMVLFSRQAVAALWAAWVKCVSQIGVQVLTKHGISQIPRNQSCFGCSAAVAN